MKSLPKIVFGVVLTAVLLTILLLQIKISDIVSLLSNASPGYLLLALLSYTAMYVLRALRFRKLLNNHISFKKLFSIVCIHNLVNNLLPIRSGELSYIYLLYKEKFSLSVGLASLVVARIFDYFTMIAASSLIIGFFSPKIPPNLLQLVTLLITLLFVLGLMGMLVLKWSPKLLRLVSRRNTSKLVAYIREKVKKVTSGFRFLKSHSKIPQLSAYSLLIWMSALLFYVSIIYGLHVDIPLWKALLGAALTIIISFIPIQGIAGFGTTEGIWAAVFISLGVPIELAVASGFGFHLIKIIYFTLLGVLGLSLMNKKWRQLLYHEKQLS